MKRGTLCPMVRLMLVSSLTLFLLPKVNAQLVVDNSLTAQQLVETVLLGRGVSVFNIQFKGAPVAIGRFKATGTNIGLDSGVIMSTGNVFDAVGPNNLDGLGTSNNQPGDADLNQLSGGSASYDAAILEFDFVPVDSGVKFRYVFASEEYPEFVNRGFNDVFAFFISGPGIPPGKENIALVPQTNLPVTIDNVNSSTNPAYYVNNSGGATVQYDGFTVVLEASLKLIPCSYYHIKLAIQDVKDFSFDSGIFLGARSFSSGDVDVPYLVTEVPFTDNNMKEGCKEACFVFYRSEDLGNPRTINFSVSGTAQNGVDYSSIPDSVTIPAGQTFAKVCFSAYADNNIESVESIIIKLTDSFACTTIKDSILIEDLDSVEVKLPPAKLQCKDTIWIVSFSYPVQVGGGSEDYQCVWRDSLGNVIATGCNTAIVPKFCQWYYVTLTDTCTKQQVVDSIFLPAIKELKPIALPQDTTICQAGTVTLRASGGKTDTSYLWTAIPNITIPDSTHETITVNVGITTMFLVTITDTAKCPAVNPCPKEDTIIVRVFKPSAGTDKIICIGDSAKLKAAGGQLYSWLPATGLSAANIANPIVKTDTTTTYTVTVTDTVLKCTGTDKVTVFVKTPISAYAGEDVIICSRSNVQLNGTTTGTFHIWSPKSSLSDPNSPNPIANPSVTTSYVLTVFNGPCFSRDTVVVSVIDSSSADFAMDIDSCEKKITLINRSSKALQYDWYFYGPDSTLVDRTTEVNPIRTFEQGGEYRIKLYTNSFAPLCSDSVERKVSFARTEIDKRIIPNIFTPNDDSRNDVFKITGGNAHCAGKSLAIYNRWGAQLFETSDRNHFYWDGKTSTGVEAPEGVYFYIIIGEGFKDSGHVTLMR